MIDPSKITNLINSASAWSELASTFSIRLKTLLQDSRKQLRSDFYKTYPTIVSAATVVNFLEEETQHGIAPPILLEISQIPGSSCMFI